MAKITQTAGRNALGTFAPEFAHFNDDVLFGENWNNEDIDLKTRSIITVVALMAQGITDSSLKFHLQNAKDHGNCTRNLVGCHAVTGYQCTAEHYRSDGEINSSCSDYECNAK